MAVDRGQPFPCSSYNGPPMSYLPCICKKKLPCVIEPFLNAMAWFKVFLYQFYVTQPSSSMINKTCYDLCITSGLFMIRFGCSFIMLFEKSHIIPLSVFELSKSVAEFQCPVRKCANWILKGAIERVCIHLTPQWDPLFLYVAYSNMHGLPPLIFVATPDSLLGRISFHDIVEGDECVAFY